MRKTFILVAGLAVLLGACGTGAEQRAAGAGGETGPKGSTATTVPSDPTSYAAQEWATFLLADLPVRFWELEDKLVDAYNSSLAYAILRSSTKGYRMEVSPLIHEMGEYMQSLAPAVGILEAAGRAGARDNDLADLAPELVMFHSALAERLEALREMHGATLALDGDRWDLVAPQLRADPFPQSFVCAYFSIAAEGRWSSRLPGPTNAAIARGPGIFRCDEPEYGADDDAEDSADSDA